MSWDDPAGAGTGEFPGYRFILDHSADTVPTASTGTFTTHKQVLMPGPASGIWFFHLVSVDRVGHLSPMAAHYQVRIGAEPANGTIAGHIEDQGTPLGGVHVALNGGLFNTYTTATGDYTFQDRVPALDAPYTATAMLPGFAATTAQVKVTAGSTTVQNFTLSAGGASSYRLGMEIPVSHGPIAGLTFAMGRRDTFVWASIWSPDDSVSSPEGVTISRINGNRMKADPTDTDYGDSHLRRQGTDVGWDGARFYALDTYGCLPGSGLVPSPEHTEATLPCLQMRTYDAMGKNLAGWTRWTGGYGRVAWNGSSYGTFFEGDFRELSSSLAFTDGKGPFDAVPLTFMAISVALWDGANYALLYEVDDQCYFVRYDRNHAQVLAPVNIDKCYIPSSSYFGGLIFDGSSYHAAYTQWGATWNSLVLRSITASGTLGTPTVVRVAGHYVSISAALAYDHRNLLLTYSDSSSSVLEIRTLDHALVKRMDLGAVTSPLVSFNPQTGQGGVAYVRNGALYFRSLFAD